MQGPCLAARARVPLGQARRARHTWACTHGVHRRVYAAGPATAGSRRAGGRRPGAGPPGQRLGPPGRAGTKGAAGRGQPGRAVIGGGEPGAGPARPGGDWPRPPRAPRGRNPSLEPRPETRPYTAICAGAGRRRGSGSCPASLGWPLAAEPRNLCAQPHPTPSAAALKVPRGPGREAWATAPRGRPNGRVPVRGGPVCPSGKGLGLRQLSLPGAWPSALWQGWKRGQRTGDTQDRLGVGGGGGGCRLKDGSEEGCLDNLRPGRPSLTAWVVAGVDDGDRTPDRVLAGLRAGEGVN